MPATYPSGVKAFTSKSDGPGNTILAAHVNDLQNEVMAIETDLTGGLPAVRGGTGLTAVGTKGRRLASTGTAIAFQGLTVEQTTAVTGTQNDFDLTASGAYVRCTGAAPVFTGFTVAGSAPATGDFAILDCLGTTVKVSDQTGSTAANQIICDSTQGQIVGINGKILIVYDGTTTKWRASLLEQGAPVTFTPTWTASGTAPALGDGTLTGRYAQDGKTVWCELNFVAGGTSTFGTGTYAWALPLTAADANKVRLTGDVLDSSASAFWIAWTRPGGTTTTVLVAATGSTIGTVAQTFPASWASGDSIRLEGEYEIT